MIRGAAIILLGCLVILIPLASAGSEKDNEITRNIVAQIVSQEPVCEHFKHHHRSKRDTPKGPEFHLYTRDNRDDSDLLVANDHLSVDNSSLDPSLPTLVVVHGFWENSRRPWMHSIKNKRLDMEPSANVILVNWEELASATFLPYIGPTVNTQSVGDELADLLNFLREYKSLSISNTHIIGFSLGAHVAGVAGYHLKHSHDSILGRITGLDPAGPIFAEGFVTNFYKRIANVNQRRRLDSSDADFVDVIRTSEGSYGSSIELGHVDFLMNGGSKQPGCRKRDSYKACNHARAHMYFIESMTSEPSYGYLYKNYWNYKSDSCLGLTKTTFGYNINKEAAGVFYAKTDDKPPFLADGSIFISLHVTGNESLNTDIGYVKVKMWSDSSPWEKMARCEPDNPESEFTAVVTIPPGRNENSSHQIAVCFTKNLDQQLTQVTLEAFGNLRYSLDEEVIPTLCPYEATEHLPIWAWVLIGLGIAATIKVVTVLCIVYHGAIRKKCCPNRKDQEDDKGEPSELKEMKAHQDDSTKIQNQDNPVL